MIILSRSGTYSKNANLLCIRHYDQIIIKENFFNVFFFLLQILRINIKKTHKDLTKDVIYAKVSKVFVFV